MFICELANYFLLLPDVMLSSFPKIIKQFPTAHEVVVRCPLYRKKTPKTEIEILIGFAAN